MTVQACHNCGGVYPHTGTCPVKNKQCKSCRKHSHFAKLCRGNPKYQHPQEHQHKRRPNKFKKRIQPVTKVEPNSDSSDENYLYEVKRSLMLLWTPALYNQCD